MEWSYTIHRTKSRSFEWKGFFSSSLYIRVIWIIIMNRFVEKVILYVSFSSSPLYELTRTCYIVAYISLSKLNINVNEMKMLLVFVAHRSTVRIFLCIVFSRFFSLFFLSLQLLITIFMSDTGEKRIIIKKTQQQSDEQNWRSNSLVWRLSVIISQFRCWIQAFNIIFKLQSEKPKKTIGDKCDLFIIWTSFIIDVILKTYWHYDNSIVVKSIWKIRDTVWCCVNN